jgi:filamentous hemagglutinin
VPKITREIFGNDKIPGPIYDFWGGIASEFSSGFIKDINKRKSGVEDKK